MDERNHQFRIWTGILTQLDMWSMQSKLPTHLSWPCRRNFRLTLSTRMDDINQQHAERSADLSFIETTLYAVYGERPVHNAPSERERRCTFAISQPLIGMITNSGYCLANAPKSLAEQEVEPLHVQAIRYNTHPPIRKHEMTTRSTLNIGLP